MALVGAAAASATTIVSDSAIARDVTATSDPGNCPPGSPSVGGYEWCPRVSPSAHHAPVVAVIGDSTSRALNPGMLKLAADRGWRYIQAGEGGCSFLPLAVTASPAAAAVASARRCARYMPAVQAQVTARYDPDVWIVSDRFALAPLVMPDGRTLSPGQRGWRKIVRSTTTSVLRRLTRRGARVILVLTPPPGQPVDCAIRNPPPTSCASAYSTHEPRTAALDRAFRSAAASLPGKVVPVSIDDVLCPTAGHCPAVIDGVLARYDGVHFTATFSRKITGIMVRRAEAAGVSFRRRS